MVAATKRKKLNSSRKRKKRFRKERWWGWTIKIEERDFRMRQLDSNWGVFELGKLWYGSKQLSEGFMYKKTSTTTNDCRRIALRRDTRVLRSVVRWSTVCKSSAGSGVSNPSFGKTERIRMMGDNEIRQSNRMEWVKNGTDSESTYSKGSRSWVKLSVTREKKAEKKKGTAPAQRTSMSSDKKKCRWKVCKISTDLTGSVIRLESVICGSSREVEARWDRWATKECESDDWMKKVHD